MIIKYIFSLDDNRTFKYSVDLNRSYDFSSSHKDAADWCKLEFNQCSNCPLNKKDYSHCPPAIDLQKVITDFQKIPASAKVKIKVITSERTYYKETNLEVGVRALIGLVMATSSCPILSKLKMGLVCLSYPRLQIVF